MTTVNFIVNAINVFLSVGSCGLPGRTKEEDFYVVYYNYGNPAIGDLGFVYAKLKWMHSFKAFNLKGHFSVIPSMIEDTKNNREKPALPFPSFRVYC